MTDIKRSGVVVQVTVESAFQDVGKNLLGMMFRGEGLTGGRLLDRSQEMGSRPARIPLMAIPVFLWIKR